MLLLISYLILLLSLSDKRKAEDELETVNPKKKIICLIASIKEDVSSIKVVVDSLKEDVASLKATVNSLKSTFDLLSTKKDSLAIFTSFKETARIPASVKNIVRPVIQNSASSEDLKVILHTSVLLCSPVFIILLM
jgi:hypothetical protein